MVNAIGWGRRGTGGGVRDSHLDTVEFPVVDGWKETQVVFVANELRDLGENVSKILGSSGKVSAAPIGFCNRLQHFISLGKSFLDGLGFFRSGRGFLRTLGFDRLCAAKFAAKRDGQHADVGRFEAGKKSPSGGGRGSVEPR